MSLTNKKYNPLKRGDYSQGYQEYNYNYYKIPKYPSSKYDKSKVILNQDVYKFIQAKNLEDNLKKEIKNTPDERYLYRRVHSLFPTPKLNQTFVENNRYKIKKISNIKNCEKVSLYTSIVYNNFQRNSNKQPYTSTQKNLQTKKYSDNIKLNKKCEEALKTEKNMRTEESIEKIKSCLFYFGNKIEQNLNNFINSFKDENRKLIEALRKENRKLIEALREENKKLIEELREGNKKILNARRKENKQFLKFLAQIF